MDYSSKLGQELLRLENMVGSLHKVFQNANREDDVYIQEVLKAIKGQANHLLTLVPVVKVPVEIVVEPITKIKEIINEVVESTKGFSTFVEKDNKLDLKVRLEELKAKRLASEKEWK